MGGRKWWKTVKIENLWDFGGGVLGMKGNLNRGFGLGRIGRGERAK